MANIIGNLKAILSLDNKQFNQGLKKSQAQAETFGKGLSKTSLNADMLTSSLKNVSVAAIAAFGPKALTMMIEYVAAIAKIGKAVTNAELAYSRFSDTRDLAELRAATGYMVDDLHLMHQAIQAVNLRLREDRLPLYFKFATIRAAETGVAVDYLVNSIVTGIGRESRLVLDNLGISLKELNEYIAITGDFGEAAFQLITEKVNESNISVKEVTDNVSVLTAQWKNLQQEVATGYADKAQDAMGKLSMLTFFVRGVFASLGEDSANSFAKAFIQDYRKVLEQDFRSLPNWLKTIYPSGDMFTFPGATGVTALGVSPIQTDPGIRYGREFQSIGKMESQDATLNFFRQLTKEEKAAIKYLKDYADFLIGPADMAWKQLEEVDVEFPGPSEEDIKEWKKAEEVVTDFGLALSDVASIGITSLAGAISELVSGGDPLNVLKNFLTDLGNMLMMYGASLIALGVGEELATKGGPYGAIIGGGIILAAGAALAAIGGAMKESISGGAYSGGGSAYQGGYSGGANYGGGYDYNREVVLVARGEDLVAVINRQNFRNGYYG